MFVKNNITSNKYVHCCEYNKCNMTLDEIKRLKLFQSQIVEMARKINIKDIEYSLNDLNLLAKIEDAFIEAIRNHTKN